MVLNSANFRKKIESRAYLYARYNTNARHLITTTRMSTIQSKIPTYEEVVAMRAAADKAERIFNKIGLDVAAAEFKLRYLESELIIAKRKKQVERVKELRGFRDEARASALAVENTWNDQLDLQGRLWTSYCAALEAHKSGESSGTEDDTEDELEDDEDDN